MTAPSPVRDDSAGEILGRDDRPREGKNGDQVHTGLPMPKAAHHPREGWNESHGRGRRPDRIGHWAVTTDPSQPATDQTAQAADQKDDLQALTPPPRTIRVHLSRAIWGRNDRGSFRRPHLSRIALVDSHEGNA